MQDHPGQLPTYPQRPDLNLLRQRSSFSDGSDRWPSPALSSRSSFHSSSSQSSTTRIQELEDRCASARTKKHHAYCTKSNLLVSPFLIIFCIFHVSVYRDAYNKLVDTVPDCSNAKPIGPGGPRKHTPSLNLSSALLYERQVLAP